VAFDNTQVSMPEDQFQKHFPNVDLEKDKYGCCDYCVNHWGIDLCGCGSGQKVGECDGDFYECRHNIPAQTLDDIQNFLIQCT